MMPFLPWLVIWAVKRNILGTEMIEMIEDPHKIN